MNFVNRNTRKQSYMFVFVSLLVIVLVGGCAIQTTEKEKQQALAVIQSPNAWAVEGASSATKATKGEDVSLKWLQSFNDPAMLKLIKEAKTNNFDLQVAAANMDKAWLLARQSGAALKPMVDLSLGRGQSGSAQGGHLNSNVNVGLQASWELDVWGRISAGVSTAKASAQSAQADYIFAQHSLSASVAKTYFKVIEAKQQAGITQKNLKILEKTLRITQAKYDNGISSAQDVALTRANLASAQEQFITINGSQRDASRALEVLLGRYPNATLDIPSVLPTLPPPPPAGVPSNILERRPDIISAERKVASAFNTTDQAKAARLPRIYLTSTVSGSSNSLSEVLDPANVAWQVAANLVAPLFDGGKRKIDVEIATVAQKQAVSNYAQKALAAFSEVENNLDQSQVLANREVALNEVQKQSAKAYRIANLRYQEGEIDLLDTLQIQQQAISAESNLLSIKRSQLEQRVNLYLSLGGGW